MVRSFLLVLVLAAPAMADGRIAVDLNRLDPEGPACRLTFVATNGFASLGSLVLETVLFDRAGRVAALTLFDFGGMPEGRRRVRQFDVPGVACADLAQVLVNGVAACAGADPAACAEALDVTGSAEGVEVAQ